MVAFEAVARLGTFTRAADELALTQGAISKQIRQLEQVLGARLFERAGGRVSLTGAGSVYLQAAQEILTRFRIATLSVGGAADPDLAVNVVALPTFAAQWLIPRLPHFLERHDPITVNVTTRVQPYDFFGAAYDVAISYAAAGWTHPEATLLFEEQFIPVASPAYRDAHGLADPVRIGDAALLQQTDRPTLWADWFANARIACEAPYRGPVFDRFSMTIVAARNGMGIALVPRFLVVDELRVGHLVTVSDSHLTGEGAYHVVVPMTKSRPASTAFRAWLLDEASELADPPAAGRRPASAPRSRVARPLVGAKRLRI
jgi:LysR family glycine cleavage system transcriptional activator